MAGKKEQLIKVSKKTQFKKGNKAAVGHDGAKASTIRAQLAWVRDQDIDPADIDGSLNRLMNKKPHKGESSLNMGRLVAVRAFERLVKKMDPHLFDKVINQTEGNLTQEIVLPPGVPAPTKFVTDEEAAAAYQQFIRR